MKPVYKHILLVLAISAGCTKDKAGSSIDDPDPIDPITINVLERSTNKPVAGATVYLKKCSQYDIEFGCLRYSNFKTLITNNAGEVTISDPGPAEAIEVQHSKYWQYENNSLSDVTLTPKTIIEVSVKRVKSYSTAEVLYIGQHVADCYWPCYPILEPVGLPLDTVIFLKGAGYFDNQISWNINYLGVDSLHTTPAFYINGFDTAKVNIEY